MNGQPIAIVVPWYGPNCQGGAESLARALAHRLSQRGRRVEILTTCVPRFQDPWSNNVLHPGLSLDGPVLVRRFLVSQRDSTAFDNANIRFIRGEWDHAPVGAIPPGVEDAFLAHGINSPSLLRRIARHVTDYAAVIGLPYGFGLVLDAVRLAGSRGILMPCLHDEGYARMAAVSRLAMSVPAIAAISTGEASLAIRLLGAGLHGRLHMVGTGIEPETLAIPASPPAATSGLGRFLLCLGRRDPSKGCNVLTDAFLRWRAAGGCGLDLVFAGPGSDGRSYADLPNCVHDLGLVDNGTRNWLLANCLALAVPSRHEAYSRVLMEAWHLGRPVAVDARCNATAEAAAIAGAPMANSDNDWQRIIGELADADAEKLAAWGKVGQATGRELSSWDKVIDRIITLVDSLSRPPGFPLIRRHLHQVLTACRPGDAISSEAIAVQSWFRSWGMDSKLIARYLDPALADRVLPLPSVSLTDEPIIYHHSIGSPATDWAVSYRGPKALLDHNITPPRFFAHDPQTASNLQAGIEALPALAAAFPIRFHDSVFNRDEFARAVHLPPAGDILTLPFQPETWCQPPENALESELLLLPSPRLLFVGRLAPNKRQDRLLAILRRLRANKIPASLILVGHFDAGDDWSRFVLADLTAEDLTGQVRIITKATQAQLAAAYRAADVYVSVSEHEGFGVPLVEAMAFEVPVVALNHAAVGETLGGAGVCLPPDADDTAIATAIAAAMEPADRRRILIGQRKRLRDFLPAVVRPIWLSALQAAFPPKVAVVVTRCGREVAGGAEALALAWARLVGSCLGRNQVEVLTTCARDYMTWENFYQVGDDEVEGVRVRRFKVDIPRNVTAFDACSAELVQTGLENAGPDDADRWMRLQGPVSSSLNDHLRRNGNQYDAVIFVGYLYATTWFGLPLVADRAILAPCAHDEWCMRFGFWDRLFRLPKAFWYLSEWERRHVRMRFHDLSVDGPVVSAAIQPPTNVDSDRFLVRHGLQRGYILYLGRIDPGKGCDLLFDHYLAAQAAGAGLPPLVLIGRAAMQVPDHPDVKALGFVDETSRWDAIAGCGLLINPSPNESLSLVILEAWSLGRPTLVNRRCGVTVDLTQRSGGGRDWADSHEFAPAVRATLDLGTVGQAAAWVRQRHAPEQITALLVSGGLYEATQDHP